MFLDMHSQPLLYTPLYKDKVIIINWQNIGALEQEIGGQYVATTEICDDMAGLPMEHHTKI